MRTLLVHAHPIAESYSAALRDRAAAALRARGDDVDVLDLYRVGFEPYLDADEWSPDTPGGEDRPDLSPYIAQLRRADHLVFVYPTWFGGPPAMFKGWLDRVWIEGVAFEKVPDSNRPRARLQHVRSITVITTYGSSRRVNILEGEPGKRLVRRWLRVLCHPMARSRWLALYDMDRATDVERAAFLERLDRAFT